MISVSRLFEDDNLVQKNNNVVQEQGGVHEIIKKAIKKIASAAEGKLDTSSLTAITGVRG